MGAGEHRALRGAQVGVVCRVTGFLTQKIWFVGVKVALIKKKVKLCLETQWLKFFVV